MWLCIEFLMSILLFALMMLLLSFCVHNLPTGRASAYLPVHLLFVCVYSVYIYKCKPTHCRCSASTSHTVKLDIALFFFFDSLKSSLQRISWYPCKIQGFSDDSFRLKNLPKFVSLNWFDAYLFLPFHFNVYSAYWNFPCAEWKIVLFHFRLLEFIVEHSKWRKLRRKAIKRVDVLWTIPSNYSSSVHKHSQLNNQSDMFIVISSDWNWLLLKIWMKSFGHFRFQWKLQLRLENMHFLEKSFFAENHENPKLHGHLSTCNQKYSSKNS